MSRSFPFTHPRKSQAQRQAEFTAWVTPHMELLYRTAWRFTGHAQDAEDLVQEMLLRLYEKPDSWAKLDHPATWLMRALHNLFVDHWRHTRNKPLHNRHNQSWQDMGDRADPSAEDPMRLAHSAVLQQRLDVALDRLPKDQRAILVMHDMLEYTVGELAGVLQLPLGTVKSRLFRARRHLRQAFSDDGTPTGENYVLLDSEMNAT